MFAPSRALPSGGARRCNCPFKNGAMRVVSATFPVPSVAQVKTPASSRHPRRKPFWRLLLLGLVLLVGLLCWPPVFQNGVRGLLKIASWRSGWRIEAATIRGSLFSPLIARDLQLSSVTAAGTVTRVTVDRATARFSFSNLLFKRGVGFWRELVLEKTEGAIDLAMEARTTASPPSAPPEENPSAIIFPAALHVRDASFIFRQRGDFVRIDHASFHASNVEAGRIDIRGLEIRQPWLATQFTDLTGMVTLQERSVTVSGMKLGDTLALQSASADLLELLGGRLQMEFALAAFRGSIRGELRSAPGGQHVNFEGSGTFAKISIAQLAQFLEKDADGEIRDGRFTFRGSPRDLPKATFSTRFEATDFRWGQRRWNSFTLGATLVNRRLMLPEFRLQQVHNSLALSGEMAIPADWREWWKDDFNFKIAARLDDLSEFSQLLRPHFAAMAGKLAIDGAVRGRDSSFEGDLKVSGAELSYGTTPLDKLEAALAISGNELRVTRAELVHGADFIRGNGVVNILGEKRYWGELKSSIADLALYSAVMQPPIAPRPFAGGLTLDWSGDGAAMAHSGAFTAQFKKIRPLGARDARPLNLEAEATYSPASIFFSRFVLADAETKLSARVVATPTALDLQNVRLTHGDAVWLEGAAALPLNVWSAWQGPATAAWWNDERPCLIALTARNLSLRETLALTGRDGAIRGEIDGRLETDGSLAALTTHGALALKKISAITAVGKLASGEAELEFDGPTVSVLRSEFALDGLDLRAAGVLNLGDPRVPQLGLSVSTRAWKIAPASGLHLEAVPAFYVAGPLETPEVSGEVRLIAGTLERGLDLTSLVAPGGNGLDAPVTPLALPGFPLPQARLNFTVTGTAALKLTNGNTLLTPQLRVTGEPAALHLQGSLGMSEIGFTAGKTKLTVDAGTLFFSEAEPANPGLVLHAHGSAPRLTFSGTIFGSLAEKQFVWESTPPLESDRITQLLATGGPGALVPLAEPRFTLDLPLDDVAGFSLRLAPPGEDARVWPEETP